MSENETTEAPAINPGLFETVVEAQKVRDEAREANQADYNVAVERFAEIGADLAERRNQLNREDRALRVARASADRAFYARNEQADAAYKTAVFGDQAEGLTNYDAGLDDRY